MDERLYAIFQVLAQLAQALLKEDEDEPEETEEEQLYRKLAGLEFTQGSHYEAARLAARASGGIGVG